MMKQVSFVCLLTLSSVLCGVYQHNIVVVTASYNNKQWYKKNLLSLFYQKYENWHLIYIDDASPDGTGESVEEFIKTCEKQDKVTLIKNTQRKGALENQFNAIHSCDSRSIIIILDGDDWLPNRNVLSHINTIYADENVWLTYGQFIEYPTGDKGFCCEFPLNIIRNNLFRVYHHTPSHMRTFYAGLFQRIKKEDLCDEEGNFFMMTGDIAAMFPMIEMARDHFKFIPDITYVYNSANELNDYKVSKELQRSTDLIIRKKSCYEKIDGLF